MCIHRRSYHRQQVCSWVTKDTDNQIAIGFLDSSEHEPFRVMSERGFHSEHRKKQREGRENREQRKQRMIRPERVLE